MLAACEICGELGHDPLSCRHHSEGVDYDEAGRQLLETLGSPSADPLAEPKARVHVQGAYEALLHTTVNWHSYGPLNQIWAASGCGSVWVGGIEAARKLDLLKRCGITHIVQCMNRPSLNVHAGIRYYDFPIESWRTKMPKRLWPFRLPPHGMKQAAGGDACDAEITTAVGALFAPAMEFIGQAVDEGGSVLIHCFAGAHRAGTTGVAWLMHAEGLNSADAIAAAQRRRSVIDPEAYGDLRALLQILENALRRTPSHTLATHASYARGRERVSPPPPPPPLDAGSITTDTTETVLTHCSRERDGGASSEVRCCSTESNSSMWR